MSDQAAAPKMISLTMPQFYGVLGGLGTILTVVVTAVWAIFSHLDDEFDQVAAQQDGLIHRQDSLHKDMREFTEKMVGVHFGKLSEQINGIGEDINTSQELFLTQANAMLAQVEKTATNKAGLENVKEELEEEKTDKQALQEDVDVLNENVREIWAFLGTNAPMGPSSIEPASGPTTQIRPAFKPLLR